jgi:ABC-type bacteriocin/lantibiotic exporter with double-glycine peptidase domain
MRTLILVLAGLAAGCAPALRPSSPPPLDELGVLRLDVPVFPDRADQCGPAALAGVLEYWGSTVTVTAIKKEINRASLKDSPLADLMLTAQDHGMSARLLDGGLAQVKKELDAGHPVVAFVDRSVLIPAGHYLVVTGYDARRNGVYVNTDARKNAFMTEENFEKQWERTDRWALLILPSGG